MSHIPITLTSMGFSLKVSRSGIVEGSWINIGDYIGKFAHRKWDQTKKTYVLVNEYFHYDRHNEICYLPRFELQRFCEYLRSNGCTYKLIEKEAVQGAPASFLMLPHIQYKNDKQKNAIEYLTNEKNGPTRGLALQTGLGKLQSLDAKIRTPNGWETMGDMYVGKEVIAPDGTITKVVGVYPQGIVPIYRISFEDGRSTECGLEHLWKVNYVQWKDKWRVITTYQIARYLTQPTYKIRMGVPLIEPEIMEDVALPIDPYALGVLLGDGNLTESTVSVCKPDQFVKDELDKVLYPEYKTSDWHADDKTYSILEKNKSGHIKHKLREMGLIGTYSDTKFIPDIYMRASPKQRLSLIQGLMDTDGYVDVSPGRNSKEKTLGKGGVCKFCTTSPVLAKQFQEIIRSLGGLCRIKNKKAFYTYKGERKEGIPAYILSIRHKQPQALFRLPRKKEKAPQHYQYADRLKLRIKSVEYVGNKEAQCIEVDHPDHLYITDDYIVTHNTVSFIWALQKIGRRALIVMTSRLEQWISEINKYTNLTESDIYLVQGQGSLSKLFSQIDQEIKPKIILASTQTIKRYIGYDENYQHLPHFSEICEKLNVGIVGTDEYHEHFYTNFLIGIMANPKLFIPITATFTVNDKFVKNIFDQFIPQKSQFTGGDYERYVNVTSYRYDGGRYFLKPYHYTRAGNYSQVKFEEYLLSKKGLSFLDQLIKEAFLPIIRQHYIDLAEKGEKLLFICSTREFCDYLARVFKVIFKDKTVSVFYSGMSTTILEKYDIILSTPGSSGTGRDIKNLRTCFVFENTQSEPRNLQFLGRLRRLPKNTPEFIYLWLSAIPKHNVYNNARSLLYGNRALQLKHFTI